MRLSALYIWGCLVAFSACDSCPEPEDAASWVKLKPQGHCEDEENFCPYRITLPPLSIQLPRPFRELEKMAKELQNLKEVVNRLRRDCQECKERQRGERDGWKDHGEEEERRTQSGQAVRITSTLLQENTPDIEGIIMDSVRRLNHSSLDRRGWSIDRGTDADQGTIDQNSEMSREIKIFDPSSFEERPEDIYEIKQAFSPVTEDIQRERNFQPGELFYSSIPKTKDFVQSEMSKEVKIFNPSLEDTPKNISDIKNIFSPTTDETQFQGGELLESSIPRTKDFPQQSATHGKQQANIFRERNVKNISGILAARRRMQNMTDMNGSSTSNSGNANTRTIDLSMSAGNRRVVNFSRAGGPLRPKTYINSRGAKVSDEDRVRNPAAGRTHLQAGDRTVRTRPVGTGFSPVRSAAMRVKETSPHTANLKPGANSRLTPSAEDEKMTATNLKSATNIRLTSSAEDEKITTINLKPGTNTRLTPSTENEKMAIINSKPNANNGLNPSTEDELVTMINPNPAIKIGQTTSAEDEKMTITNPKPATNTGITMSTEDEKMAKINSKLSTNTRQNPLTDDEKMTIPNQKPGMKMGRTPSTEGETMTIKKTKLETNSGLNPTTQDDKKLTVINPRQVINSRLNPSTEDETMTIKNPKLGTNSGLNPTTQDEKMMMINPKPRTNSRLIPSTDDKKLTVINPQQVTNSRLNPPTEDETTTIINPKPAIKTGQTTSTEDETMTVTNPATNSRLTSSTHDKNTNKEDTSTDHGNNPKDARQVTVDGEENFRKLNKTDITKVPTNLRKENQGDVSHTTQTTNKSIFSVINRAEQPNLIKVENEHMGSNMSSTADVRPSAGKTHASIPGRQVEKDKYLTTSKGKERINKQEDMRSRDKGYDTFIEKETNPQTPDYKDQTQSEMIIDALNEEISYNSPNTGTVKKDMLSNSKTTPLESDLVNPTPVPSVKMTSVSTASKHEPPVVSQGTKRISIPIRPKSDEGVGNVQSISSKTNISNVRFVKNITRVMLKLPVRPGRHPATVIPGPKLNTINKMSENSNVVVPSNVSISGRNSNFGRKNGTVMMKPSYVRRRPSVQTEPNTSNQNKGFKENVSAVTQSFNATGETSTERTDEIKDIPHATGSITGVLNNQRLKNTGSQPETSEDAGDVQDINTVLKSKVVHGTEDNVSGSLQDPFTGGKESKQFSSETTYTSSQHPMGVDKFSSKKNLLNPSNSGPSASTLNKELSSVNDKTQPKTSNSETSMTVTDQGESTKHIPAVTNTHDDMVKNISQDPAMTPVSFEDTAATRELELIKLNEEKVPKNSGDVLSNPNSVDNVRGNNGERYTVPVALETLTNVEEIKGSKVFSLSPEDTAEGFKAIAVGDEVTQKDGAEHKILSTCVSDCETTPTQQPTTQNRPSFDSDRGRGLPQDCADYTTKTQKNGVYRVTPRSKNSTFHVFCDMETSGGGWTLIQHRFNGSISFNRTWDEYKRGFGKLMGEFWLGNDKIHWLTQAKNMSLRIELEDFEGIKEYAQYDHFHVANESQQYRLTIDGYSGTAGDAMKFNKKYNHDQKLFTTPDRDNDQYPSGNCGDYYSSGWWFDACMSANLNGKYYTTKYKGVRNGIFWGTWHNITMEYYPTNERQSFKTVRMMIRPQNYAN